MVARVGKQLNPLLLELMKVEMVVEDVLLGPSACYDVHTSWLLGDQSFISVGFEAHLLVKSCHIQKTTL